MNVVNKALTIYDRMGNINLYPLASKDATLRVRLLKDGSLEAVGRAVGGAWSATEVLVCAKFLDALRQYLTKTQNYGYHYLVEANIKLVNQRYTRSK
ncbi:hypothetical protein LUCX_238 [Xanthomonas phage vB_XciM_LucasX]|nr:hypothetical protein LUCX_238 [Xanthomonas phage vB_XciM_LucasX]